jgi:4-amino-4-deoxy-L-arabinose transferase-like glycosyltransferase
MDVKEVVMSDGPLVIVATLTALAGVGLILLSAAFIVVLAPFAIAGLLYLRWRIRQAFRRAQASRGTTVDAEYRIIEIRHD